LRSKISTPAPIGASLTIPKQGEYRPSGADSGSGYEQQVVDAAANCCKHLVYAAISTLNPNGESTRSEGAQFLYNILKYDAK